MLLLTPRAATGHQQCLLNDLFLEEAQRRDTLDKMKVKAQNVRSLLFQKSLWLLWCKWLSILFIWGDAGSDEGWGWGSLQKGCSRATPSEDHKFYNTVSLSEYPHNPTPQSYIHAPWPQLSVPVLHLSVSGTQPAGPSACGAKYSHMPCSTCRKSQDPFLTSSRLFWDPNIPSCPAWHGQPLWRAHWVATLAWSSSCLLISTSSWSVIHWVILSFNFRSPVTQLGLQAPGATQWRCLRFHHSLWSTLTLCL